MQHSVQRQGVIYALCAYTIWGLAPIYFKTIAAVPAAEILTHRMIWSCALLVLLTLLGRQWHKVQAVLCQPRLLLTLTFTSITVGGNWLLFIWAINNGHLLDASLGYYINPLFNVVLGMLFLNERLRRLQWWAVGLAGIGVVIQLIVFGSLPWIALVLAGSFAIYGLIRKKLALDALTGLLFFTAAATRLKFSTLGFFQYIGPSLMFILAVTLYGEALALDKLVTFACIWSALVLFSLDGLRSSRQLHAN